MAIEALLPRLAARDDFDDFEAIAGLELAVRKFGRGDGLAVVLDDDAAGHKVLGNQELVERARKVPLYLAAISDDEGHFRLLVPRPNLSRRVRSRGGG